MYTTDLAEKSKIEKYAQLCDARGIKLLPAAFNAYGGWGTLVLRDLVEPHFDKLRAEEKAETGQEWNTLRERELLFQQVSVAIAQGNSMILDTMDHDWRNCDVAAKCDTRSQPGGFVWSGDWQSIYVQDVLGGMP